MRNIQYCWCVYAHVGSSSKEKKTWYLQQDPANTYMLYSCVVVHVMLPVIRLSVHDDDDDVKVKIYKVVGWKLSLVCNTNYKVCLSLNWAHFKSMVHYILMLA